MFAAAHGIDLMDICAGGHLTQNTLNWLGERSNALRSTMSSTAANFFNTAQNMYSMISQSDAMLALRNLTAKSENAWQSNNITYLGTVQHLQTAAPVMQRWVMAEPRLRDMYLNNEVEGYGKSYTNIHGNVTGEQHYDWRRVMDGVMVVKEDQFGFKHYHDCMGDDEPLTIFQKVDILNTWNAINKALDEGEMDPTSPVGNLLG